MIAGKGVCVGKWLDICIGYAAERSSHPPMEKPNKHAPDDGIWLTTNSFLNLSRRENS